MEENKKENEKKVVEGEVVKGKGPTFSKKEIEDGKLMGILSYIGFLAVIPYFVEKNNKFVMYHAKQGLNLFLLEMICSLALTIATPILFLLIGIIAIVSFVVGGLSIALSVIGIINVLNGEAKELPIIEKYKLVK